MTRAAHAVIDADALRHNLRRVRQAAPGSRVMAVIKANAYGHGLVTVAQALWEADALAVAFVSEALWLRDAGITLPLVVLQGVRDAQELVAAAQHHIQLTFHQQDQLRLLETVPLSHPLALWVKVDTGMHRLGFSPVELANVCHAISLLPWVKKPLGFMTHLACADDRDNQLNHRQLENFNAAVEHLEGECSVANSAGVLSLPESHCDWVRPGIMLYGSSPFLRGDAAKDGLTPVMTLSAPIIAVKQLKKGDSVGYGGDFVCPQDMPIGIVAIGYGDGYPRHAASGTPVLVKRQRARLVGRVSMDMITLDLRGIDTPQLGDEVELWGQGLSVDEVALHADTISYELLCNAGNALVSM